MGPRRPRILAAESTWDAPYRWNRSAAKAGQVRTVFLGSLMDFCEDRPDLVQPRKRAWRLMQDCRHLMFLILSKRPENFQKFLPWYDGSEPRGAWKNVAIGATLENQAMADRRHRQLPEAALWFWSAEPLIGYIDAARAWANSKLPDWVIVGGESGPEARPCDLDWIADIVYECHRVGVPCFVKQLGSNPKKYYRQGEFGTLIDGVTPCPTESGMSGYLTEDPKGGQAEEWPQHLRIQQFPVWPAAAERNLV